MKSNETPDKIYLYPYSTDGIYEVETKPLEGTIEYTRTDAFIEKACEWLDKNWTSFVNHYKEDGVEYYSNLTDNFKKYMKGE